MNYDRVSATIGIRAVDPRTNDDNLVLKQMVRFRSNVLEQFSVMDAKLDHLLEMAANIQLLVQGLGGVDLCVAEVQSQQQIVIPVANCDEPEIGEKGQLESRKWTPYTIAKLESPSEKFELMRKQNCTKDEEANFLIEETTKMEAQKVFDEMLQSEKKMVCVTETMETKAGAVDEVNSGPILPKTVICDGIVGLESKFWKSAGQVQRELSGWGRWMKPIEDGGFAYEIEFILSSFPDEAYQRKLSAHLKFCKHVAIEKIIVRRFVGDASRSVWKKKNKEATWSFDPGGGRVFDESPYKKIYEFQFFDSHGRSLISKSFCLDKKIDAEFVSRICMGDSLADHFVNPQIMDFHSSFRLQIIKTVTLFSKASSFAFLLCNASKNVSLSSVLSLVELRFVTDSKLNWIFQVTATPNIVDLLEIVCLGIVEVDCTKVSSYRIISTSVFSRRQSTKCLYNETIHHRILVRWVNELSNCASAIGLSASKSLPSWRIKLSFESHFSLFYMYYVVTTGSFDGKDSFQVAEPILVFKGLLGYSFTCSVRGALVELGTILFLEKWSYIFWKWIVWEQIWFGWVFEIWPEFGSFKDDGLKAIPSRWNGTFREREESNLSHLKKKLIGAQSLEVVVDQLERANCIVGEDLEYENGDICGVLAITNFILVFEKEDHMFQAFSYFDQDGNRDNFYFGGGTLDISLLTIKEGILEVMISCCWLSYAYGWIKCSTDLHRSLLFNFDI